MKIVQVMPEFGLAGAEIMCENLTCELSKAGHTVLVVSLYDYHSPITERLEATNIDVRYLDKRLGLDLSMIKKLRNLFKIEKPDVVHTHRYVMQYVIPAAIMAGVKTRVHTVHNIAKKENNNLARKLAKFFYKWCRVTPVALSELIQDSIVEEYGLKKEQIPVILNGIDISKCIPKNNYKITGMAKLLHIGRFSEQKNHKGLIEAFKILHDMNPNSELQLIGDGEKKSEIDQLVEENSLAKHVKFLGLQSDVYGYLHEADIFVLPSLYEGVPMTLIEAMGTGLPVVATAVGGVPDMLVNGESAILTPVDDKGVADALCRLVGNRRLRERLGHAALAISEQFSSKKMAEKYVKTYTGNLL